MAQAPQKPDNPKAAPSLGDPAGEAASIQGYAQHAKAANTWRGYESDFRLFQAFCAHLGYQALPASTEAVVRFVRWMADETSDDDPFDPDRDGLAANTVARRVAALNHYHADAGYDPPGRRPPVKQVLEGVRRVKGGARGHAPLLADDVRRMAALCDRRTAKGLRDRALILLGFGGAFRRSELAGLTYHSIRMPPGAPGMVVELASSKGDQKAQGRAVSVHRQDPDLCPVRAVYEWIQRAGIGQLDDHGRKDTGPLFRSVTRSGKVPQWIRYRPHGDAPVEMRVNGLSTNAICRIITNYAADIGHDPATIGAHSLRAGFVTSALLGGASMHKIQEVTGHQDIQTLIGYYRYAGTWDDHPAHNLV